MPDGKGTKFVRGRTGKRLIVVWRVTLEHEAAVRASKAEAVRSGILDRHGPGLIRYVIEIAVGVLIFKIDGRRRTPVSQSKNGDSGLQATRTTQQMTGYRLGRADGEMFRVFAEGSLHRA